MAATLPTGLRWQLWWRSLFLQASWGFERMQGLGVAFVLAPGMRRCYGDAGWERACARHLEYFNTHPFLAPAILGALLRLEEEGGTTTVTECKQVLAAPCAAMGDAFFWGGLRPLAAVAALLLAVHGSLLAPLVLLLLFNGPHLYVRYVGLVRGYMLGLEIFSLFEAWRLPDRALRLKQLTMVLMGILCADVTWQVLQRQQVATAWGGAVLPALLLLGWPTRKSISPLLLALAVVTLLLAWYTFF